MCSASLNAEVHHVDDGVHNIYTLSARTFFLVALSEFRVIFFTSSVSHFAELLGYVLFFSYTGES